MGVGIISAFVIFWCCFGLSIELSCMSRTCHGNDICVLNLHNGVLHGSCTSHHHYSHKNDCQNQGYHMTDGHHCQCTAFYCVKSVIKNFVGFEDNIHCFDEICDHNRPVCMIKNDGGQFQGGCHHAFQNFCQYINYHLATGKTCRCMTENCILQAMGPSILTTITSKSPTASITTSTDLPTTILSAPMSSVLPAKISTPLPTSPSTDLPATASTVLPSYTSTALPTSTSTDLPVKMSTNLPTTTNTPLLLTTSRDKCQDLPGINCTEFTAVYACGTPLTDKYCAKSCGHCKSCEDLPGVNCTELILQGNICSTKIGDQKCPKSCNHCTAEHLITPYPF